MDDVLASFVPEFRARCQKLFGKPDGDLLPLDWGWSNFNLNDNERMDVWNDIAKTPNFHMTLKKMPDTDRLSELDRHHQLYFITARRPGAGFPAHVQTSLWLEDQFDLIRPVVIVATNKVPLINALDLDAFLDDRADTCEAIQAGSRCAPFLLDCSHNQHCNKSIPRVRSLNEFADAIYGIALAA